MLAPALLGPIAVAAYSYMALVPVIQPRIMKLLTTEKERQIVMKPLREVSKKEKIIFPIVVTIFVYCNQVIFLPWPQSMGFGSCEQMIPGRPFLKCAAGSIPHPKVGI